MVLTARKVTWRLALAKLLFAAGTAWAQPSAGEPRTIRDGIFTADQAARGQIAYTGPCDRCHGYKLDGAPDDPDMLPAPPVAGAKFLREWNGRSLASLYAYLRATMPANNPGYLSEPEVADIVAYMLSRSAMPPGRVELQPDPEALAGIVIVSQAP